MKKQYELNAKNLSQNNFNTITHNGFSFSIFHIDGEPEKANRVRISNQYLEAEILPSKGFSLRQAWVKGTPVFWEAPCDLPDTETLNLWSDEISINGVPTPGFTYLKTFIAGVELLGLRNWGMPKIENSRLHPLHGEASNIPVENLLLIVDEETCCLQADFIYRSFDNPLHKPWYESGDEIFCVTRKIILKNQSSKITVEDCIKNISSSDQLPDWGYHITFKPENGARYLVHGVHAENRGGEELQKEYDVWKAASDSTVRKEKGVIFKGIRKDAETNMYNTLLLYPDGRGIAVTTPETPYFQTWFCCGGAGTREFETNNEPVLKRNWDGMGIEIGSSALDHDGNTDPEVEPEKPLQPGESRKIVLTFEIIQGEEVEKRMLEIRP